MVEGLDQNKLQDIIKQYHIVTKNEAEVSEHQRTMMRANEDYKTFIRYKERKFFEIIPREKVESQQRTLCINKIRNIYDQETERQEIEKMLTKN